jgi:flavorubredoxin
MAPQLLIVFESHTGNTRKMALAVAAGAEEIPGVQVVVESVAQARAQHLAEADGLILGTPTRNAKIPPAMKQFLELVKQAPVRGKLGAVFGSYGWSGEAVGLMRSSLVSLGMRVPGVGVRAKRTPDAAALDKCRSLGASVGQRLVEQAGPAKPDPPDGEEQP